MPSPLAKRSAEATLSVLLFLLGALGLARPAAATPVPADSPVPDWERVAACESSGRWHINTGNGYHGGLQIDLTTWRAYGGERYAPRADLATRDEQIAIAERIVRDRGMSAWPNCSYTTGTRATPQAAPTGTRSYVVRPGDSLSTIAERTRAAGGAEGLYDRNRHALPHGPDRIYPGQRLQLRA
ncbi:transglycosylase family protein [Streptomyces sp. NPDC056411]|uniref:transglycosylase family protein n=1 Tax=Streptomyces sp. NPDC056411 TaxID=3345813 RepID=UPI0035D83597